MRFGLQKLTLLDYPGMVACTVFSSGCNLRCPFCHNASLIAADAPGLQSEESILDFLSRRRGILDGVCITGGEPLLNAGMVEFALKIKSLGFKVKLDTNGTFPERLAGIIAAGAVDYIAMDIKNSPVKYLQTTGADVLSTVKQSVDILMSGELPYEFRTTVTGNLHEVADFAAIGQWISGAAAYFLQSFIASDDILDKETDFSVAPGELEAALAAVRPWVPNAAIRGQ